MLTYHWKKAGKVRCYRLVTICCIELNSMLNMSLKRKKWVGQTQNNAKFVAQI